MEDSLIFSVGSDETEEPARRAQLLLTEATRILADLDDALAGTTAARQHVASATRELAAIQKLLER